MSLRINKDNIYFILPEDRYSISNRIDSYMAKDFTLCIKAKVNGEFLEKDAEYFLFSRNGMHSGISVYKNEYNELYIIYNWWIKNLETGKDEHRNTKFKIPETLEQNNNEYGMICDDSNKIIECYFNGELIGIIDFFGHEKYDYKNSFYWFGCGSMIVEEQHRYIGDFDFSFAFLLDKKISLNEMNDILNNYENYTYEMYSGLKKLKDDFYLKNNFAFLFDFKNKTRYKIWDMTFSGNYPQLYIEDNIYF
jgi:hypothetical protein